MKVAKRYAHLVGSMPYINEATAMEKALTFLNGSLHSLPDGEIGEKSEKYPKGCRSAWTQVIMDSLEADTENWKVSKKAERNKDGVPIHYTKASKLRPKKSPKALLEYLDFKWLDYFRQSYPIYKKLKAKTDSSRMKFQVGLPTGLGITFVVLGPIYGLRYAKVFNKRMAYEANEIAKIADKNDLIFQIEVPIEVIMFQMMPPLISDIAFKSIIGLARLLNPEIPVGIHLCLGDLNNEALGKLKTLKKLVKFSNKLVNKWPSTHQLAYMHYPLAEGNIPPETDVAFYNILKDIKLPKDTRFIAGFVHEKLPLETHKKLLKNIENIRGEQIDIACSCGMGRRTAEIADQLFKIKAELLSS
ncbi:MAG: hypothetical protein AAGI07_18025 [Bacteroidota bacterium]